MNTEFKPEELLMILGQNIKTTRERIGYGISELAVKIRYERNCLSAAEYGEQNLEYNTVLNLSRALNVPFPTLFSRNYQNVFVSNNVILSGDFVEDNYLLVFIENYQREMKNHQLKQVEVYAATDICPETISRVINKKVLNPTIKTLYAMAYTCGTDMYSLFLRKTI